MQQALSRSAEDLIALERDELFCWPETSAARTA